MTRQVIDQAIDEMIEARRASFPVPPAKLTENYRREFGVAGGTLGGLLGAVAGSHIGIAGAFGAIAGGLPLAVIGCVLFGVASMYGGSRVRKGQETTVRDIEED